MYIQRNFSMNVSDAFDVYSANADKSSRVAAELRHHLSVAEEN